MEFGIEKGFMMIRKSEKRVTVEGIDSQIMKESERLEKRKIIRTWKCWKRTP